MNNKINDATAKQGAAARKAMEALKTHGIDSEQYRQAKEAHNQAWKELQDLHNNDQSTDANIYRRNQECLTLSHKISSIE